MSKQYKLILLLALTIFPCHTPSHAITPETALTALKTMERLRPVAIGLDVTLDKRTNKKQLAIWNAIFAALRLYQGDYPSAFANILGTIPVFFPYREKPFFNMAQKTEDYIVGTLDLSIAANLAVTPYLATKAGWQASILCYPLALIFFLDGIGAFKNAGTPRKKVTEKESFETDSSSTSSESSSSGRTESPSNPQVEHATA